MASEGTKPTWTVMSIPNFGDGAREAYISRWDDYGFATMDLGDRVIAEWPDQCPDEEALNWGFAATFCECLSDEDQDEDLITFMTPNGTRWYLYKTTIDAV